MPPVGQVGVHAALGLRLKRLRRDVLGLSRKALAALMSANAVPESSAASIQRYETGERCPRTDYVSTLASLAGVSLASVFDAKGSTPAKQESGAFDGAPEEGIQLIGHIKAELMRREDGEEEGDPHEAFEAVERRVMRLRAEGRLGDAGWNYWLALRRGAALSGGYSPLDPDPTDPAADRSAQSIPDPAETTAK